MNGTVYHCCDTLRRNAVAAHPVLNGIDAVEVVDRDLPGNHPLRQRTLLVYCLKPVAAAGFTAANVRIEGGERVRNPQVLQAGVASGPLPWLAGAAEAPVAAIVSALAQPEQVLVVRVAQAGDYAAYTLRLVQGAVDTAPPTDFDPRMAAIAFSFKAECPTDFDCRSDTACAPETEAPPAIDYLARDFASFRRLLLDRMAQLRPDWRESTAVDGGVALIELLAYVGDHLAYRQDAAATEAYLGTARSRVSLRRHAELVDYAVHDGNNARCFVQMQLGDDLPQLLLPRAGTRFLTRCDRVPRAIAAGTSDEAEAMAQQPTVFEPMHELLLQRTHNHITLHTWGDSRCCLPRGATRATLLRPAQPLQPGQWLLFEEVLGPVTGAAGDADPTHRQVVRLTAVRQTTDPLPTPPLALTEIEWAAEDALHFALCVSAVTDEAHGSRVLDAVSVARGNVLLADHGRTLPRQDLGVVPAPTVFVPVAPGPHCGASEAAPLPPRWRPLLADAPLTQAAPLPAGISASAALQQPLAAVLPQATLRGSLLGRDETWHAARQLYGSDAADPAFVAEVENDGRCALRFGDGRYGRRPRRDTAFSAVYRVGNGSAGQLGAGALWHVVGTDVSAVLALANPLPAQGARDPEGADSVRRRAPEAFRTQERAVTPADYSARAEAQPGVQRAAARMRWTGSWHTVFVTVDTAGGAALDGSSSGALATQLDRYRMAGHDIAFEPPVNVSLRLWLHVCVAADHFRADVRQRLVALFSNRRLADGRPALFHPDNFSFGQTVWLSPLLAAARGVAGVESVAVRGFGRQDDADPLPLRDGQVLLARREIARLDNDPNFPEHGKLTLELHGGK